MEAVFGFVESFDMLVHGEVSVAGMLWAHKADVGLFYRFSLRDLMGVLATAR